jgi:alkanesulfonate monooxygenase SsuD/methylene tetrahydromethanopterin reductase-like flavin-dependent oxidoreductase (luciferase family)
LDYGHDVKFGVFAIPATMNPSRSIDVGAIADELGYDLIGVQDHPYQWRFFDTWTLLVAIAMRTERITVFPDVASLPMRPPAVLAKAAASLDVLSGGRAELGLGAGGFWDAIKAMGGAGRTPAESVSALEEAIHVVRLMWSGDRNLRYQGQFYSLSGVNAGPKPAHAMGVWLGAYRPRMLGITGRLADGWVPSFGNLQPPDLVAGNERIDAAARAAGRDPKTIRRVLNIGVPIDENTADLLTMLAVDCGMDSFLIAEGGDDPREDLGRFMREVAPRVREQVAKSRESRRPA